MSIREAEYGLLMEADKRVAGDTCEKIRWYEEENFIGELDSIYLLDLIDDLVKEIDGLHELVKELNSKEDIECLRN